MLDNKHKAQIEKHLRPLGVFLSRYGVEPDVLTLSGLFVSLVTGFILIQGWFLLGLVGLILSGIPDLLDGAVARARPQRDRLRGAFLDSVVDRAVDFILFGSIGVYGALNHKRTLSLLAFGVYGAASLISYQRAKAESLGVEGGGGFFERAERLIFLGVGLAFYVYLEEVLLFIAVGSLLSAGWRFCRILQAIELKSTTRTQEYGWLRRRARYSSRKPLGTRRWAAGKGWKQQNWTMSLKSRLDN